MIHPSTEAKILAELAEIGINGTTKEECAKQFVQTINCLHNNIHKVAMQIKWNDKCHEEIKKENEKLRKEIENLRIDFEKSPEYHKIQNIRDRAVKDIAESAHKLMQRHKEQITRMLVNDVRRKGFYKPATLFEAAELIKNECCSHGYEATEHEGYLKQCGNCPFVYRGEGGYEVCSFGSVPERWFLIKRNK